MSVLQWTFVWFVQSGVLFQPSWGQDIQDGNPPVYKGSFRAVGEIRRTTYSVGSTANQVQYFEELYDDNGFLATLTVRFANGSTTYFEDLGTKQIFRHSVSQEKGPSCVELHDTSEESGAIGLSSENGQEEHFFVRDVLSMKDWTKSSDAKKFLSRNISADVWDTELKLNGKRVIVGVAWNTNEFGSTADSFRAPVQIQLHHVNPGDGDDFRIDIFRFTKLYDATHQDLLQLPDGIYCGGYKKNVPLPKLDSIKVFSYHAEMRSPVDQMAYTSDVWVDMNRALYRIDYTPTSKSSERKRTLIVSGNEEAIYTISMEGINVCNVTGIMDSGFLFDQQMITDPRYIRHMKPSTFFTGNDSDFQMSYKKRSEKGGIPCHVWEVLRNDWPPETNGVQTLWEWCFTIPKNSKTQITDSTFYLVNLDISVLQVPKDDDNSLQLYPGQQFKFLFYNSMRNPPELVDLHGFDITTCYGDNDMMPIVFTVPLSPENYRTLSAASTLYNPKFLSSWRKAIESASGLPDSSLRVTKINAAFDAHTSLIIRFEILERFPARANTGIVDSQVGLIEMKNNLQDAIDKGILSVDYDGVTMTPAPGRLTSATEAPPSTVVPFKLITWGSTPKTADGQTVTDRVGQQTADITDTQTISEDNVDVTTIAVSPDVAFSLDAGTRYSSGTLAGTTVAMFVLGTLLGASGTYIKCKVLDTRGAVTGGSG